MLHGSQEGRLTFLLVAMKSTSDYFQGETVKTWLWYLSLLFCGTASAQTTMIVDVRTGRRPSATYNLVEAFVIHKRCIPVDFGYIDFGRGGEYREWFAGGGCKLFTGTHLTVASEVYLAFASGPEAKGAKYFWPWTGISFSLSPKITGEAVFFPYVPLNKAGTWQFVIERIKLERTLSPAFKAGAGYGAYQFGGDRWQHRPFITATLTPFGGKFGSFEAWLQKFADGAQIQGRYEIAITSKKKE